MIEFVNILLSNLFGTDVQLLSFAEATEYLINAPSWIAILSPTFLITLVTYFFTFYAVWQVCCIYPFRLLKKLIHYPGKDK